MLYSDHSLTTHKDGDSMDFAYIGHNKLCYCCTNRLDNATIPKPGQAYVGQSKYRQKAGIHIASDSSDVPSRWKSRAPEFSVRIFYTPGIHRRLWSSIVGHQ